MTEIDAQIQTNRIARVELELKAGGKTLAGREVTLTQKKHKFQFGSNWCGEFIALANGELTGAEAKAAEQLAENYFALFNQATLPFYWGQYEKEKGMTRAAQLRKLAEWYRSHGVALKGHPLCWHTLAPDWLLPLSDDEILETQLERIRRDVSDFAGLVDSWDVVNEAVIMPIFDRYDNGITRICQKLGRIDLLKIMFETARKTHSKGSFLINDFDTSPAYDILVEGCIKAGIQFDAIGIQSHMHQGYWGPEKTLRILRRFERFGLPIHFTENTIISGKIMPPEIEDLNDYQVSEWPSTPEGEERQAREVITHIKTLLAHPLVESITWWDIKDGAWLNAPSGLFRRDGSPKPSYHALKDLLKKELWYAPSTLTSDGSGKISFQGPQGEYEISVDGKSVSFELSRAAQQKIVVEL